MNVSISTRFSQPLRLDFEEMAAEAFVPAAGSSIHFGDDRTLYKTSGNLQDPMGDKSLRGVLAADAMRFLRTSSVNFGDSVLQYKTTAALPETKGEMQACRGVLNVVQKALIRKSSVKMGSDVGDYATTGTMIDPMGQGTARQCRVATGTNITLGNGKEERKWIQTNQLPAQPKDIVNYRGQLQVAAKELLRTSSVKMGDTILGYETENSEIAASKRRAQALSGGIDRREGFGKTTRLSSVVLGSATLEEAGSYTTTNMLPDPRTVPGAGAPDDGKALAAAKLSARSTSVVLGTDNRNFSTTTGSRIDPTGDMERYRGQLSVTAQRMLRTSNVSFGNATCAYKTTGALPDTKGEIVACRGVLNVNALKTLRTSSVKMGDDGSTYATTSTLQDPRDHGGVGQFTASLNQDALTTLRTSSVSLGTQKGDFTTTALLPNPTGAAFASYRGQLNLSQMKLLRTSSLTMGKDVGDYATTSHQQDPTGHMGEYRGKLSKETGDLIRMSSLDFGSTPIRYVTTARDPVIRK